MKLKILIKRLQELDKFGYEEVYIILEPYINNEGKWTKCAALKSIGDDGEGGIYLQYDKDDLTENYKALKVFMDKSFKFSIGQSAVAHTYLGYHTGIIVDRYYSEHHKSNFYTIVNNRGYEFSASEDEVSLCPST